MRIAGGSAPFFGGCRMTDAYIIIHYYHYLVVVVAMTMSYPPCAHYD